MLHTDTQSGEALNRTAKAAEAPLSTVALCTGQANRRQSSSSAAAAGDVVGGSSAHRLTLLLSQIRLSDRIETKIFSRQCAVQQASQQCNKHYHKKVKGVSLASFLVLVDLCVCEKRCVS